MKFATIGVGGTRKVALIDAEAGLAWPVSGLLPRSEIAEGASMLDFIARFPRPPLDLEPIGNGIPLDSVVLEAPIPRPARNIFCVGKNYRDHAHEFTRSGYDSGSRSASEAIPEAPVIFTKASSSVIGDGAPIPLHPGLDLQVDYEAELAVVIGVGGRAIRAEEAWRHVWGYTIVNDATARDLQAKHKQWFLGKSLDGYCPMGPWIVTRDELDARHLSLRSWVNGELRQDANTEDLIFDIPALIATLSAGITLEPGDIIATGTPAGVGIGFSPPRFLRDGDVVDIEIEGIGRLRNTVLRQGANASSMTPDERAAPVKKSASHPNEPIANSLHVDRCGSGPALVMVHGLGGTSNTWFPQMSALQDRYTLIAPDLAGAGRSPTPSEVTIESHVADLIGVLDAQGIARAHFAAHSMGTVVCQHLAVKHPDRVEGLLLVGPIHAPAEAARKALGERAAKARSEGMTGIADAIAHAGTASDTKSNQPTAVAFVRESLVRQDPEGYAKNCEALASAQAADLKRIRCPVLLVTGDEDKTAPPAAAHALASTIPQASAHVLSGCGHWATVERAKQVNYLFSTFLNGFKVPA